MPLVPVQAIPGISKSVSDYASGKPQVYQGGRNAQGRYTDANHVRFVAGFPEKIGGWQAISGVTGIVGIPRAHKTWRDNTAMPRLGIGTESHLYSYDGTNGVIDITPMRTISVGTLGNNPFTTVNGSATVAVADASQHLQNNDWVKFSGASVFNGVTIVGWYIVSGRSGTGYNITAANAANASSTGGGASVVFSYPRKLLGTNPLTTVSGSAVVTVADTAHGATTGDYVTFGGASAFNNVTISGEYQLTVVDANSYTITAGTVANASSAGGGASVNVTYDITLGTLTVTQPVTYGQGTYGSGPYGFSQTTTPAGAAGWTLDRYGSQLLGAPIGGTIYVYDPAKGGRAYPLLNAPTDVLTMFVTPERFVVALGTAVSAMQMAWADQTDYTVWTSTPTNTANTGRTRQGGTKFIGGAPIRDGVSLAITDRAAFQLNYSGDNFVYDTPEASDNASLISAMAIGVIGEAAFWMSNSEFWTWDGTVHPLPSDDIRDYVFRDINQIYISKCWVGVLRAKKEVWFNYPSSSATEIDSYVIYHTDQQCWSVGKWSGLLGSAVRTAWVDADLFSTPLVSDVNGVLYQHETGTDDNGQPLDSPLTFSPIDVSNGDANVDVFGFIPDFTRLSGSINLTINTRQYPQDTNVVSGPFTITATDTTPLIDLRVDGKMVGFELESNALGGDFRFGVPRLNVQPAGARI